MLDVKHVNIKQLIQILSATRNLFESQFIYIAVSVKSTYLDGLKDPNLTSNK